MNIFVLICKSNNGKQFIDKIPSQRKNKGMMLAHFHLDINLHSSNTERSRALSHTTLLCHIRKILSKNQTFQVTPKTENHTYLLAGLALS